jgi:hypothetical protein
MFEKWRDENGSLDPHRIVNSVRRFFSYAGVAIILGVAAHVGERPVHIWTFHGFCCD